MGAPRVVGVMPWGEHRTATATERLVGLEGTGLGLPKVLLSPSPLQDPFPGDLSLPLV